MREYRSNTAHDRRLSSPLNSLGSDMIMINRPTPEDRTPTRAGRGKACRHASIYSLLGLMSSLLQPMWPFGLWLRYELVLVRVEHLQERTSYSRGLLAALL